MDDGWHPPFARCAADCARSADNGCLRRAASCWDVSAGGGLNRTSVRPLVDVLLRGSVEMPTVGDTFEFMFAGILKDQTRAGDEVFDGGGDVDL